MAPVGPVLRMPVESRVGSQVEAPAFRVHGLGFRVQGSGFRV